MAVGVRRDDAGIASSRRATNRLRLLPGVLVLAVLVPLVAFLVSVWLRGWQLQAVESGSMEPTYPVGSLLVVEPIDASQVEPGMVVVFVDPTDPDRIVTHRVVGRAPGESLQFWTQGDANATRDPHPVPARLIRGRVRSQVNGIGSLVGWLRWPRSFLLLIVLPGLWLLVTEIAARRRPSASSGDVDNH